MKLSILIPTLVGREPFLNTLMERITPHLSNEVEVVIEKDNREQTTGKKRNILLERAKGSYISFVDDDDLISPDYIPRVLEAIKTEPDVVGMHLIHYEDGWHTGLTYHSLKYDHWWEEYNPERKMMMYYRNPNHLNPVKRELALKAGFPDITEAEDKAYSKALLPLLKTEVYIEPAIYHYFHRNRK